MQLFECYQNTMSLREGKPSVGPPVVIGPAVDLGLGEVVPDLLINLVEGRIQMIDLQIF
jgi:hypothetical protein